MCRKEIFHPFFPPPAFTPLFINHSTNSLHPTKVSPTYSLGYHPDVAIQASIRDKSTAANLYISTSTAFLFLQKLYVSLKATFPFQLPVFHVPREFFCSSSMSLDYSLSRFVYDETKFRVSACDETISSSFHGPSTCARASDEPITNPPAFRRVNRGKSTISFPVLSTSFFFHFTAARTSRMGLRARIRRRY